MDARNMEHEKNKTKRISEIAILLMVFVCVSLILAEVTNNLISEINSTYHQTTVERTDTTIQPTEIPEETTPLQFFIGG
jgi:hypothetical protein